MRYRRLNGFDGQTKWRKACPAASPRAGKVRAEG
jgi:hypothetical protein